MPEYFMHEWPPASPEYEARRENVVLAARLMMNAVFTAPVTGGMGTLETHLVYGQKELDQVARKMEELAFENPKNKVWKNMFKLEAAMVREETDAIVFVGSFRAANDPLDVPCGKCGGVPRCWVYDKRYLRSGRIDLLESRPNTLINGPLCVHRVQPLGIAVSSAVHMAFKLFVDCRPMMSVGIAGQKLGYCPNSPIVVGLPVSARSKNPYVDVRPDYHVLTQWQMVSNVRRFYYLFRMAGFGDYRQNDPIPVREPTPPEIRIKEKGKTDQTDEEE